MLDARFLTICLVAALSVGTTGSLGLDGSGALDPLLSGRHESSGFYVPAGTTYLFDDLLIVADSVRIDGTLKAIGADGDAPDLAIQASSVDITGAILGADGQSFGQAASTLDGGDGTSIAIVSDSIRIAEEAFIRLGAGGKGADVVAESPADALRGGHGGDAGILWLIGHVESMPSMASPGEARGLWTADGGEAGTASDILALVGHVVGGDGGDGGAVFATDAFAAASSAGRDIVTLPDGLQASSATALDCPKGVDCGDVEAPEIQLPENPCNLQLTSRWVAETECPPDVPPVENPCQEEQFSALTAKIDCTPEIESPCEDGPALPGVLQLTELKVDCSPEDPCEEQVDCTIEDPCQEGTGPALLRSLTISLAKIDCSPEVDPCGAIGSDVSSTECLTDHDAQCEMLAALNQPGPGGSDVCILDITSVQSDGSCDGKDGADVTVTGGQGSSGSSGGGGSNGGQGGPGSQGSDSALIGNKGGDGGHGLNGLKGSDGGPGGPGESVTAQGGNGGNGTCWWGDGGDGGDATAVGGKGGTGGAGGKGGDAGSGGDGGDGGDGAVVGGAGGNGGNCGVSGGGGAGGAGGAGGTATAIPGTGGAAGGWFGTPGKPGTPHATPGAEGDLGAQGAAGAKGSAGKAGAGGNGLVGGAPGTAGSCL